MHLVINTLSVHSGGGLTSWLHLLPAMHRLHPEMEYTVLVTKRNVRLLDRLPSAIRRTTVRGLPARASLRKVLEQFIVPVLLWTLRADWVFGLANTAIVGAPCRVFLNLENANPYSALPISWSRHQHFRLRVLRFLGGLSARRATVVRFLSENSRTLICTRARIPRSKTVVIPHGVDLSAGSLHAAATVTLPDSPYVLTVANLLPHKNVHTLIEAFGLLVRRHAYPGSLVVVGSSLDAEYAASLKAIVATAQLTHRVHFIGWIDPGNLPALYAAADCFVFPSAEETFGMPVLEAMAAGTPVVVPSLQLTGADCFIPYEEICGTSAVYCNAFNPADMAEQIGMLVSNPVRRAELGELARQRATLFGWDRIAGEVFAVLHERTRR